jgi:predicted phage terminase large subunit-like protein
MMNWPASSLTEESYPLQAAEELYRRRTARKSLHEFVRQGWGEVEAVPFVDNWHVGAICEHLQAVTADQISRLLINVPPGMGKSLLTCVFWPAWEWTLDPSVRWFFASYDQRLSTRDAVRCRALLAKSWYRACCARKFSLTGDQNQKTYYETDQGGYRLATSTGGHASGEHPDRIVCDDPHNVQQAESAAERQAALDWWDLTMSTRGVSRNARRVIIMQRLHQDDLSGHVLAEGGWVHLCLPMRFEVGRMPVTPLNWNDPRGEDGALLCPVQFDNTAVSRMERALGAYGTAGQLQQRPVPREGGMFKQSYFNQRVRAAPYQARRVRYWDRAATQDGGCYTAGTLLARSDDGNWYVEHVVHGQWEPDLRDEQILAAALRDRLRYGPNHEPLICIEHEPGSSGVDAYKHMARKLAGFRVCADRPTGAKAVRAEPWSSQCAAKNVYIVEDGTWDIPGWIDEHCHFPMGKMKDRVDSASGAFAKLANRRGSEGLLRVVNMRGPGRKGALQIMVCSQEDLAGTILERRSLLVSVGDPPSADITVPPVITSSHVLGSLTLCFADLDPAALQETWDEVLPSFGRKAEQLIMTRDMGKQLWSFLLRKRDPAAGLIIVQDDCDRRALSLAYAIADVLQLGRGAAIYRVGQGEWKAGREDVPPNRHIYQVTKSSRAMVV